MLPWLLCGISAALCVCLIIKIISMRRSMREISSDISRILNEDTNNLIYVSSADKGIRHLASELNTQLMLLRKQRLQYLSGDRELKEAITNVSHDLRTPLTAICGYLDLLDSEDMSPDACRYVDIIRERAENLASLTEELFRYSVISASGEELETSEVDMCGALEESISAFFSVLKKRGIEPVIKLPNKKVLRMLDRSSLLRIYSNLLSNAVKYSDGDLSITLTESGETVFSNTASDLSETAVGKLFDRFYTVENARRSTGLGLSIAKTLVERMKGEISAEYHGGILSIRVVFPETIS